MLVPRPYEKWERFARAEEAQRIADLIVREKLWTPGRALDQWVERVWCIGSGMAEAGAAATCPLGVLDVVSAANVIGYLQADFGISLATGVSAWASQIGGVTLDMAQGTGANQPAYSANDATLWGRPSVTGDGSNDFMTNTWNPDPPGTTPSWFHFIFKPITWLANKRFIGGIGVGVQAIATPQMRNSNGTNGGTVSPVLNTWNRGEALFNNTVGDYLIAGARAGIATGTNTGNTNVAANAVQLFAGGGTNNGNMACNRLLIMNADPTALQKAIFDGLELAHFNGNITL
jgi:hypothetical protein